MPRSVDWISTEYPENPDPEDDNNTLLEYVSNYLPVDTANIPWDIKHQHFCDDLKSRTCRMHGSSLNGTGDQGLLDLQSLVCFLNPKYVITPVLLVLLLALSLKVKEKRTNCFTNKLRTRLSNLSVALPKICLLHKVLPWANHTWTECVTSSNT
jgi:hypothetical protein